MKQYFLILSLVILSFFSNTTSVLGQDRALWATIWSIGTPEKIDKLITTAQDYHFNKIFLQVRYRGDAMYIPNRVDSTFNNNESRTYVLKNSDFDPLAYAIKKAKNTNIEIHAWIPIFVITPHDLSKITSNHTYNSHPEWITANEKGESMSYNEHEGAFLDPGIPQVQTYLLNILSDVASNYNLAGIQLDYIRYPDSIYGYNSISKSIFDSSNDTIFDIWKQKQINSFVNKAYIQLKNINPNIKISAAVFADQNKAINQFSQNWKNWLSSSYIDQVYVMAYNTSSKTFEDILKGINEVNKEKTTIVLRAWKDKEPYYAHQINEKIKLSKKYGFHNLGFYSYSGLKNNYYLKHIKF